MRESSFHLFSSSSCAILSGFVCEREGGGGAERRTDVGGV